jgi:hypothetical protein
MSSLKLGTAVLGRDESGEFLHGYVKEVISGHGRIEIEHGGSLGTGIYDAHDVFYFRNGYPVPVPASDDRVSLATGSVSGSVSGSVAGSVLSVTASGSASGSVLSVTASGLKRGGAAKPKHTRVAAKYNRRKVTENARLLYDLVSLGFDITGCQLLALDDFRRNASNSRPNTTNTWMQHGGRASHVWVPNPDAAVADSVTRLGGHGFAMTLGEMLGHKDIRKTLPRFDVAYMDLCGFFSSHRQDLENLFRHHATLLSDRVLLHVTTCKREGSCIMEDVVFPALDEWSRTYRYGRVMMLPMKHSETMWKGAFLLLRRG